LFQNQEQPLVAGLLVHYGFDIPEEAVPYMERVEQTSLEKELTERRVVMILEFQSFNKLDHVEDQLVVTHQ